MTRQVDDKTATVLFGNLSNVASYQVSSNTEIKHNAVYLFRNKIAWKAVKQFRFASVNKIEPLIISMCGYGSQTTRQRLNAILDSYIKNPNYEWNHQNTIRKLYIKQHKHEQVLIVEFTKQPTMDDVNEIKNLNSEIDITDFITELINNPNNNDKLTRERDKIYHQKVDTDEVKTKEKIHESQWVRVRDYQ